MIFSTEVWTTGVFHPITQASQTEGEEPEADQPTTATAQSQSEPIKKKISYPQLLKEGRRFNIDLVSKVKRCKSTEIFRIKNI